jgi:hypothetical protein
MEMMQLRLVDFGCGGLSLIRISLRVVAYIQTRAQGCRFRIHDRMSLMSIQAC